MSSKKDLFVSHIVFDRILNGSVFEGGEIKDPSTFSDWGTLEDWNRYRSKYSTLFLDIDGVLVENSGRYVGKKWGSTTSIEENVAAIKKLHESGKTRIILTTSRSSDVKDQTIEQLTNYGVPFDEILFDLPHAKRIVVNDYAPSNTYRTCEALNIKRNSKNLKEMIDGLIRLD